jgi:hypothetical protein
MTIKPLIAQTRVARAKGAAMLRCFYKLGKGGFNSKYPHNAAWDGGRSDCSGFISWLLMTKRAPKPGRDFWIETTAIYNDALFHRKVFVRLDAPEVGCLVVYPDSGGRQGHIGVVVDVKDFDYMPSANSYTTIECASGVQGKVLGKAIRYRKDAQNLFGKKGAIFCALKEDLE